MAVRNFWIDAYIDGRQTVLSGGPKNKEGGMEVCIYQREEGGIISAVHIKCVEQNGRLATEVYTWEPQTNGRREMTMIGGRVTKR